MPDRIDWNFISQREGGQSLSAYVPGPGSGATIATGYDLGGKNEYDLRRHGIPSSIVGRLRSYLGLKGSGAQTRLRSNPLVVSKTEADAIDNAYRNFLFRDLDNRFQSKAGFAFGDLPPEAQTVIASVATQHGEHLDASTPSFWAAVTSQNWSAAVAELRNFKDSYQPRRDLEADVLERIVP